MATAPAEEATPPGSVSTVQRPRARPPSRFSSAKSKERIAGYLFIAPSLLHFLVFTVYLLAVSLVISTWVWDLITPHEFRGLYNYKTLLFDDPVFWISFRNTLLYAAMTVIPGLLLGLLFALAVNQKLKGIALFRAAYFLPGIVPIVAVAIVFRYLYSPEGGLINKVLDLVGINGPDWLENPTTALAAIAAMSVWQTLGWNMTFYLVGLQAIPRQLYEAAELDGAGRWARFRHVTWPLLMPITFFVLVTSTIDRLRGSFDAVFLMTQGGPGYSTYMNTYYLYKQGFVYFHYGYAAAYGWIIFCVTGLFLLVQFRLLGRRVQYDLS
jgi:ABC-type sugar transport system permease subunit